MQQTWRQAHAIVESQNSLGQCLIQVINPQVVVKLNPPKHSPTRQENDGSRNEQDQPIHLDSIHLPRQKQIQVQDVDLEQTSEEAESPQQRLVPRRFLSNYQGPDAPLSMKPCASQVKLLATREISQRRKDCLSLPLDSKWNMEHWVSESDKDTESTDLARGENSCNRL